MVGVSVSLGAGIGHKIIKDEGKRQRTYRQQQAKAAVRKFVDDVAFVMNKQTRDGLRATQRRLRDDFAARAKLMQRSAAEALHAAQRAGQMGEREQRLRRRELEDQDRQLDRVRATAPRAGRRPCLTTWSSGITDLLDRAIAIAGTDESRRRLTEARAPLHGPLRLAIAGKVKAGKSTLLNAMLGEELAPTDAGECTKIVTWYEQGRSPRCRIHPMDAPAMRGSFAATKALSTSISGSSARPTSTTSRSAGRPAGSAS